MIRFEFRCDFAHFHFKGTRKGSRCHWAEGKSFPKQKARLWGGPCQHCAYGFAIYDECYRLSGSRLFHDHPIAAAVAKDLGRIHLCDKAPVCFNCINKGDGGPILHYAGTGNLYCESSMQTGIGSATASGGETRT
jgi:hypothetical protein